jgi:hypothetical protein
MATFRGFVLSLQVRGDGWVETVLQAVHAGNTRQTFYIRDLDGDINSAHRRLGHLSLLRDAVARVLPVEIEYGVDKEQPNVIDDVTIHPRPSFDGRQGGRRVEGVVIGCSITELGPMSASSPYRDEADRAAITLLEEDGTLDVFTIDLQRPDELTGHAMLALLREAHRTRRPVAVYVSAGRDQNRSPSDSPRSSPSAAAPAAGTGGATGTAQYVIACEYITVPTASLDYEYAFIERLEQRYESYEQTEAPALWNVKITYTTAPGQTPEGDISDNGSFTPQRLQAWVHGDSPLLKRLEAALRDKLQVKLGIEKREVHEVEMIADLGSVARPIWIKINRCVLPPEDSDCACENVPTIQSPTSSAFDLPTRVAWRATAYFSEGIWRFVVRSGAEVKLVIDGKNVCCEQPKECCKGHSSASVEGQDTAAVQCHAYLKGLHHVELTLSGRQCSDTFQLKAYRIR